MIQDQHKIEQIVEYHQRKVPVKVVALANALGIRVKRTSQWPDEICGAIVSKDKRFTIWTNANHPATRRRFTIAHEIGHYVLHREHIGDGIRDDAMFRSKLNSLLESAANRYAAGLLMPWPLVVDAMEDGLDSIEKLATHFQVSKTAMSIRLGFPWE